MDKNKIKQELLAEIKKTDWCSFAKIIDFFEDRGINPHGDCSVGFKAENIVFWVGLSSEVSDLIIEMIQNEEIFAYPTEESTYVNDGIGLRMPLVKRLKPSGGYSKDHWQPVCFSTGLPGLKGGDLN